MIDWKLKRHHVSITIVTCACACLPTKCPDKKKLFSSGSSIKIKKQFKQGNLVGGFNQLKKYKSKWESSPIFGVNISKI